MKAAAGWNGGAPWAENQATIDGLAVALAGRALLVAWPRPERWDDRGQVLLPNTPAQVAASALIGETPEGSDYSLPELLTFLRSVTDKTWCSLCRASGFKWCTRCIDAPGACTSCLVLREPVHGARRDLGPGQAEETCPRCGAWHTCKCAVCQGTGKCRSCAGRGHVPCCANRDAMHPRCVRLLGAAFDVELLVWACTAAGIPGPGDTVRLKLELQGEVQMIRIFGPTWRALVAACAEMGTKRIPAFPKEA